MRVMFQKRVFLLFFLCFMLVPFQPVRAISFSNNHGDVCYDFNTLTYASCSSGAFMDRLKKASDGRLAYCASRGSHFGGGTSYKLDKSFSNAKNCPYYLKERNSAGKLKWVRHNNGDCSSILGFIVAEGNKRGKKTKEKWFWAQASVWTYLGKYAPSPYSNYNSSASGAWSKNSKIKSIIQTAWTNYGTVSSVVENSERDDVKFSVDVADTRFHYKPNGSSCGGGSYITKNIKITNNESRAINISIPVTSDAVSICDANTQKCVSKDGSGGDVLKYSLPSGQSVSVYMSTNYKLNSNVDFTVVASYEENEVISNTIYDSKRYTKQGYQAMIVLESKTANVTAAVVHESQREISFSQVAIEHVSCPTSQQNSSGVVSSNSSNKPVRKVCANNSKSNNPNDYTVYFSGCNCMSLDLGNGRIVNVILRENAGFRFGHLSPNKVYAGGGFKLADSTEGITTIYESKIVWQYADYYGSVSNNIPYYYNANNTDLYRATDIEDEIVSKIKSVLKDKVLINFTSKDSNDPLSTAVKQVPISLSIASVQYDGAKKTFSLQSGDIQMTPAYFATDGTVSYIKNESRYPISGGNKYYVPLKYKETSFPFDIGLTNFSLISSGNFWYEADCDVEVDQDNDLYDGVNGVRYRSIDVSNPFPKSIATNWQSWWSSSSNRTRMKNTFQPYPDNPLYQITLNDNKMTQIGSISSPYTDWSSIHKDGSSDFVNQYFDLKALKNSYCEINRFSVDCDK